MEDNQVQDFKNFVDKFTLAEQIEKGEKGTIFIGNTRAGKTTLSCAAAGSKMTIKHDSKYELTFLHPADQQYTNLVRDSNQSVTTKPNFFRFNQVAIIDMPGYADSSRFKQFINYHYIKTMITNLSQVRFLVVITLSYSANKYELEAIERRMLQSFVDTFPDCRDCTSIVINRVEHSQGHKKHRQGEADAVKGAFRNIISQQSQKIKSYFTTLTNDRIHIIFRPPYKQNNTATDWNEQYPQINQIMRKICFDNEAKYMSIAKLKTKVSIFKEGDNLQNQKFRNLLQQFLEKEREAIVIIKECFQQILVQLLQGLVTKKIDGQQQQIEVKFKAFMDKDTTKQFKKDQNLLKIDSHDTKYTMNQSKIIKLIITLANLEINFQDAAFQSAIDSLFEQLSWLFNSLFHNTLKQRMNYLHLYIIRRLRQSYFIFNSIKGYEKQEKFKIQPLLQFIYQQIINNTNQLKNFSKYIGIFREYLLKICDFVLKINLKAKYDRNFPQSTKKQLIDTLNNMRILFQKRIPVQDSKIIDEYVSNVQLKKQEVQLYSVLNYQPDRPEEIKNYIEVLLKTYHKVKNREQKNIIAFKLAAYLIKTQRKYAIALYFHLEIYDEVLRLVDSLETSKNQPKKNELLVKWYLALADEFRARNKPYYFQRCLQKAKLFCLQDLNKLSQIKKQLKQGLSIINKQLQKNISPQQQKQIEQQTWAKIDQQVLFLKVLHKLEQCKKQHKVIGYQFRQ